MPMELAKPAERPPRTLADVKPGNPFQFVQTDGTVLLRMQQDLHEGAVSVVAITGPESGTVMEFDPSTECSHAEFGIHKTRG